MNSRWVNITIDLARLFSGPRGSATVMLRREYDRLEPILTRLAAAYRQTFLRRTRVVAVVGSLGKTTTRAAVHAALNCPDRKFSYSNYGSSLAANLLRVRPNDRHAALEVGISGPGRMLPYAKFIRPNLVVVTSIKSDHNRSFQTLFDTRREKVKMVSALPKEGVAILNGDDPNVRWMATQTAARVITFGLNADNDIRASNVTCDGSGTTFDVAVGDSTYRVGSKLHGAHMVYPLLGAIAVVHAEKSDLAAALSRLAELSPATSRLEVITLSDGTRIVDDSQKAALESVHAAFETIARMPASRRVVVMGNIEEPTGRVRAHYRDLGSRLAAFADVVVCVGGDDMRTLRTAAQGAGMKRDAVRLAGSRVSAAIEILKQVLEPGDLVLVKGSSTQRLRRIVIALANREVACKVKYCIVKVSACDACPLLDAPESSFHNRFVRRYVRLS